jgi:hypothetical protein
MLSALSLVGLLLFVRDAQMSSSLHTEVADRAAVRGQEFRLLIENMDMESLKIGSRKSLMVR